MLSVHTGVKPCHNGKPIDHKSSLMNIDAMGDKPYDNLGDGNNISRTVKVA